MISEIICIIIGFVTGIVCTTLYVMQVIDRKNKEIGRMKAQFTLKAIMTPIVIDLINGVLKPMFESGSKPKEKKK